MTVPSAPRAGAGSLPAPRQGPGLRIAFLGAHAVTSTDFALSMAIGQALALHQHVVLATSGFPGRQFMGESSFTMAVARGFADVLDPSEDMHRIITFIDPGATKAVCSKVVRLGRVIVARGRHARNRQGQIVAQSDILCIGGGGRGTREFAELALWIDKPVFPLPFLGGASRAFWMAHRDYLVTEFDLTAARWREWSDVAPDALDPPGIRALAASVVATLLSRARGSCIVCMPFAEQWRPVYDDLIKPAIAAAHMQPIRMDQTTVVGDITEALRAEIAAARCVVAVVDDRNPNVLYEVGFAHALNKPVILVKGRDTDTSPELDLPFDIRSHRVVTYGALDDAAAMRRAHDELTGLIRALGDALIDGAGSA